LLHGKPRVEERTKALIKARIRDSRAERDVCVLDISTRGVLATTASPPARGEFVELQLGGHTLVGQVKWAGDRRFGLVLRDRVSVAALVAGARGPVTLKNSQAARKRKGSTFEAFAENWRDLGQFVQFAMIVVIVGAAAYALLGLTYYSLNSLQDAQWAMSESTSD